VTAPPPSAPSTQHQRRLPGSFQGALSAALMRVAREHPYHVLYAVYLMKNGGRVCAQGATQRVCTGKLDLWCAQRSMFKGAYSTRRVAGGALIDWTVHDLAVNALPRVPAVLDQCYRPLGIMD
jgi:hypothetical protein